MPDQPTGSVEAVTDPNDAIDPIGQANEDRPEPPDLVAIEGDLTAVEAALAALDDGSYWVDAVTGETIPDEVLADNPIARRA